MQGASKSALLINSPLFRESVPATDEDYLPSLGLGVLAKAARDQGIHVDYIDAIYERRSVTDLIATIEASDYDVVGVNIFTVNQHLIREIVESVTRQLGFVVGGLSTRSLLKSISAWRTSSRLDIVFGDGEILFPLLVTDANATVASTVSGRARFFEVNNTSPYYVPDISGSFAARDIFANEPFRNIHGLLEACIVTSRGCIYNCAFCGAARSLNRDVRVRESTVASVRRDVGDILSARADVQSIRVLDDLYLKDQSSIARATETFMRFPLTWRAMAHVMSIDRVSDRDLLALRKSGCVELFLGIESGSPRILKTLHKPTDIGMVQRQLARLFAAGISAKCYFILGLPGEEAEDMEATVSLAERMRDDANRFGASFRTSVFQFRPYHGTELFRALASGGHALSEKDANFD